MAEKKMIAEKKQSRDQKNKRRSKTIHNMEAKGRQNFM